MSRVLCVLLLVLSLLNSGMLVYHQRVLLNDNESIAVLLKYCVQDHADEEAQNKAIVSLIKLVQLSLGHKI